MERIKLELKIISVGQSIVNSNGVLKKLRQA
jgi:hypothetical protein